MEKFLVCLAISAVCVVSVWAQQVPTTTVKSQTTVSTVDPSLRCCFPDDQFTVKRSSTSGSVGTALLQRLRGQLVSLEESHMAFDYNNSRIAVLTKRHFINGWPEQKVKIVADIEKGLALIIYPDVMECSVEEIEDFLFFPSERCIPEYLTYGGRHKFAGEVETDSWFITMPDGPRKKFSGLYSLSVSSETCLPFSETIAGKTRTSGSSQQIVSSIGYYDYEVGIPDTEKFFGLPDYCRPMEEMPITREPGHESTRTRPTRRPGRPTRKPTQEPGQEPVTQEPSRGDKPRKS